MRTLASDFIAANAGWRGSTEGPSGVSKMSSRREKRRGISDRGPAWGPGLYPFRWIKMFETAEVG